MTEETGKKITDFFMKLHNASIRDVLALTFVIGALILLNKLISTPLPEGNGDTFKVLGSGILSAGVAAIFGYYFTASKVDRNDNNKPTT